MELLTLTLKYVEIGDHILVGGRLYQVTNVSENAFGSTRIEFFNPKFFPSYRHILEMDSGFPIEVLRFI